MGMSLLAPVKMGAADRRADVKATALLKLVYLEMFGHDMSWAAFNVLEVMSSSKYPQRRVGYLGAVQSFRPDTEVLMLATNLLKKVRGCHKPRTNLAEASGRYLGLDTHDLPTTFDSSAHCHSFPRVVAAS